MSDPKTKNNLPALPVDMAGKKRTLDYFTDSYTSLLLECNRHPVLKAQLLELGGKEDNWSEWLAEIAAYCNVALDGMYSVEDLEILYPQLTKRMIDTRMSYSTGIIIAGATGRMDS